MIQMRFKGYTAVGFVCFLYWMLDSVWAFLSFEYNLKQLIFREPASYIDTFMLKVSPYQMVSRLMVVSLFAVMGVLIVEFLIKKKADEKKLRESEEKFRTVVTNIEEIIYMLDKNGVFTLSQGKGLSAIGKKPDEVVGQSVFELYQDYPEIIDSIKKAFEGESLTTEINVDGLYFRSWYTPRKNQDGETTGIMGLSVNITEQKRAERERERLNTKLTQMQKMESIGSLAGGIAHDFNNLLFPIMGLSEIMIDTFPSGSPPHENARIILKAGKRGADLVKQILTFSRQSEHKKTSVYIQQVLKEALKLSRATIPSDIEIREEITTDCGPVMADPTQIHQVVMNLITNSYHAVESVGGTISVTLEEMEFKGGSRPDLSLNPGRHAVLSVSDTGTGIEPAVADKVFDPYFTTKEQGKGSGLGLSVVFGIVKDHEGEIKLESEPGKGTRFDIYLPLTARIEEPASPGVLQKEWTGSERILVVDDDESVVMIEKAMLEKLGYQAMGMTESSDALRIFAENPFAFDLVISDMTMPNLTGDRLAQEMIALRPDIPIIICTGFSEKINRENPPVMGVKGLLMKPIKMSKMARTVREVLDGTKNSAAF